MSTHKHYYKTYNISQLYNKNLNVFVTELLRTYIVTILLATWVSRLKYTSSDIREKVHLLFFPIK